MCYTIHTVAQHLNVVHDPVFYWSNKTTTCKYIMLHNLDVWPSETPTSVDFYQLEVIQSVSFYIPPLCFCFLSLMYISSTRWARRPPQFWKTRVCASACQEHEFGPKPARLNFSYKCHLILSAVNRWQHMSAALPGDLCDALIIQIYNCCEVSLLCLV